MIRKLLLTSVVVFGSTFALVNPVSAQTTDPYLNYLLRRNNQVIYNTNRVIQDVLIPASQRRQNYLQRLFNACSNGNRNACRQHDIEMRKQLQYMDHVGREMDQYNRNFLRSIQRNR